jgi:hypothetical protein
VVLPWSTWAMIARLRNDIREIRWGPAEPGLRCSAIYASAARSQRQNQRNPAPGKKGPQGESSGNKSLLRRAAEEATMRP